MKKIAFVLLGLGISILLYLAVLFLFIKPMQRSSGGSPESYLGILFIIVLPLCLVLGSSLSGYLIQPLMKQRSILGYLLISPGLYSALANLLPTLIQAGSLLPGFVHFSIISSLVWTIASLLGARLGVFLRDKKFQKSNPYKASGCQ